MLQNVIVRDLGLTDYQDVWDNMRSLTQQRDSASADEIWIVEHPPVFTLGLNGKPQYIIDARHIPVIQCDRGGQVTYHGPGQIVAYILMDLQRRHWGVKKLVNRLEQTVIDLLAEHAIRAERKEDAPGVYINGAKIAALGLRVRRGCSYHGLSFNVDMDLTPFSYINPCGFEGLQSTQLKDHRPGIDINIVKTQLAEELIRQLFAAADAPEKQNL
ncbi:MAG: lipoyl(octanoyl) transferase LipB [Gammaproteobacteria bacterium]|nr:lipoyl(octanoyl) transferase LipB [Gammaproteobacteria bacterium]